MGSVIDEIIDSLESRDAKELVHDGDDDEIVMLDDSRVPAGKEKDPSGCKMKQLESQSGIVHLVLRVTRPLRPLCSSPVAVEALLFSAV